MNRKNTFNYALIGAMMLMLSCAEEKTESKEMNTDGFRAEVAPTKVKVGLAERKSFDYLINATGKVEAMDEVTVVVERGGFMKELHVKEGDLVANGKIIAVLDPSEAEFKLEKAKIALRNAEAAYSSEILSFERIMNGEDEAKKVALKEHLEAKTGLMSARVDVKEATIDLEKRKITAPIGGKVANVKLKKGAVVAAGAELLQIINTSRLEVKVKVLESDIHQISNGQLVDIYPVGAEKQLQGRVHSINPKVDENGLVQVGILINNSGKIMPGMNARAIIKAPVSNSLVVPKQALVYRSGKPVVFTMVKNESVWNYVEVGKDNGVEVEILSGLNVGDRVILSNNLQLAHQAPVQEEKD